MLLNTLTTLLSASLISIAIAFPTSIPPRLNAALERRQTPTGSNLMGVPLRQVLEAEYRLALAALPSSKGLDDSSPSNAASADTPVIPVRICVSINDTNCITLGPSQRASARTADPATSRLRTRSQLLLEPLTTVCATGEKACPSGLNGYECVGAFEDCHE